MKDMRPASEAAAFPGDRPQRSPSGPAWAAAEEQNRVLLVLHVALLLRFYETGIPGAHKCCIYLKVKA